MDIKKNYNQQKINLFTSFLIVKNFTKIQSFIALFCFYSYSVSSQIEKPNDKSIIQSSNKLNVLLIIADDLNCDLGAYKNLIVKTPNIDRLAQRGVLFENAHNQYPLCGPSRASFMTGMYSNQTKIMKKII